MFTNIYCYARSEALDTQYTGKDKDRGKMFLDFKQPSLLLTNILKLFEIIRPLSAHSNGKNVTNFFTVCKLDLFNIENIRSLVLFNSLAYSHANITPY